MIGRLGSSITQPCSPFCEYCSLNRMPFFVSFVVSSFRPPVLLRNRHPSHANEMRRNQNRRIVRLAGVIYTDLHDQGDPRQCPYCACEEVIHVHPEALS